MTRQTAGLALAVLVIATLGGCGGGGGGGGAAPGSEWSFAFIPPAHEGTTYPGNYWPLFEEPAAVTGDGPAQYPTPYRWWEYWNDVSLDVTAQGQTETQRMVGPTRMTLTRYVMIDIESGTVPASEYWYQDLGLSLTGDSTAAAAQAGDQGVGPLTRLLYGALVEELGLAPRQERAEQLQCWPDLYYYALVGGKRIEAVALGCSASPGPSFRYGAPRSFIPYPLVAAEPTRHSYSKMFGLGANADSVERLFQQFGLVGKFRYLFGIAGQEPVDVGAGTFEAVKLWQQVTGAVHDDAGLQANVVTTCLMWLARDTGDVKERSRMEITGSMPGLGRFSMTLDGTSKLTRYGSNW